MASLRSSPVHGDSRTTGLKQRDSLFDPVFGVIMTRSFLSLLSAAVIMSAGALEAQALPAGGVGPDKKIYTKIFLFVGDAASPPYPIQDVQVLLVSADNDTVRLRTDGAGATTAYVARGLYHLITLDWVSSASRDYKWNMPVFIAPGMQDIVLTESNAVGKPSPIVAESPGEVGLQDESVRAHPIVGVPSASVLGGRRMLTDSTGLAWEVFEEQFLPSAVAHTDLPLPTVQVVLLFNRDNETRELEHFPSNWRALPDSDLAALLLKAERIRP